LIHGTWLPATITYATDDDLTPEVDLVRQWEQMCLIIPTIDSANLTIYVSETTGGTFYALGKSQTINAGTGLYATTVNLGGYRYIKIGTSAAQTANRIFRVCGYRS